MTNGKGFNPETEEEAICEQMTAAEVIERRLKYETALHERMSKLIDGEFWLKFYAGCAMQGLLAHYGNEGHTELATEAYKAARAMNSRMGGL